MTETLTPTQFIDNLIILQKQDDEYRPIEYVYETFHEWTKHRRFDCVDETLASMHVADYESAVLLSVLTITAWVKIHIPARADFYERVCKFLTLTRGPVVASELLVGLE